MFAKSPAEKHVASLRFHAIQAIRKLEVKIEKRLADYQRDREYILKAEKLVGHLSDDDPGTSYIVFNLHYHGFECAKAQLSYDLLFGGPSKLFVALYSKYFAELEELWRSMNDEDERPELYLYDREWADGIFSDFSN